MVQTANALIEPDRGRFSNSGRIAGDPDGTPEFAFYALDSRLG
jgi:hypothetical protein